MAGENGNVTISNNMSRLLAISMVFVIFAAVSHAQIARVPDDSCFAYKSLYTTQPTDIRSSNSRFSDVIRKMVVNRTYTVFDSKKDSFFGSCWIKIVGGWILRRPIGSAIKPGEYEKKTTTASATPTTRTSTDTSNRCYLSNKAYITGAMNVRSGPSTSNSKVGTANLGESFNVSDSQRGDDYCWIKISKGWIAKTGRVSSTPPPTAARRSPNASGVGIPPVTEGGSAFKSAVQAAYSRLRRSAKWYSYVINARPASIGTLAPQHSMRGGRLDQGRRQIELNTIYIGHPLEASAVLVHESCHIYQMDQGRLHTQPANTSEIECYGVELEYLLDMAPGSSSLHNQVRRSIARRGG